MLERTTTAIGAMFSGVSSVVLGTSEVSRELKRQRSGSSRP